MYNLKPCPFCGSNAQMYIRRSDNLISFIIVECTECFCTLEKNINYEPYHNKPYEEFEKYAFSIGEEAWNGRVYMKEIK